MWQEVTESGSISPTGTVNNVQLICLPPVKPAAIRTSVGPSICGSSTREQATSNVSSTDRWSRQNRAHSASLSLTSRSPERSSKLASIEGLTVTENPLCKSEQSIPFMLFEVPRLCSYDGAKHSFTAGFACSFETIGPTRPKAPFTSTGIPVIHSLEQSFYP